MTKNAPQSPEIASTDDDRVIESVLVEVREGLKVLAARRAELPAGGFDPDLVAATAALARAAMTAVAERRQQAKARRRELTLFTDDELVEHIRSLPERRQEALLIAVQGESLAGRPLY